MDVASLIAFLGIIVLAFWRKTNIGILAFAVALVLGRMLGMSDKTIVQGLSSSLFVTLTGITLLFAAVSSTGALEMISKKIISFAGKSIWVLPILSYVLGFVLAAIGPGAIPPTTLTVTTCVSIAFVSGYNPLMMSVIGCLGMMGGRIAAITPEGSLVRTLAANQGITSGVILPVFVFQVITTALFAVMIFLVFKGHKVKAGEIENGITEKTKATKNQIIALLGIVVMMVMVTVFNMDVGLSAFLVAGVLFLFNIIEDSSSIKAIPLGTIVMILGVGVLMNVISKAGGINLLCNMLSPFMTKSTAAPLTGVTAGVMTLVASGFGVVYPTLLPMATKLAESAGGAMPVAIMSTIVAGGSLAGFSPMSVCGALTISSIGAIKADFGKAEQNKMFIELFVIALVAIVWVGISAFLFANLCVNLFS
jgi:Dicarboxylate carrier protein MatC N-terminus.